MHSQSTSKNASLDISVETNVYVRPRTDVGFRETKAGIIIQVRGKNVQRKLPEHIFPGKVVFHTPSSFKVKTWTAENGKRKDNLIKEKDQSFITIRPKQLFLGLHGHQTFKK